MSDNLKRGFGLVEVLVAIGLLSGLLYFLMHLGGQASIINKESTQRVGWATLLANTQTLLMNDQSCKNSLGALPLDDTFQTFELKKPNGTTFLAVGQRIDGLEVTDLEAKAPSPASSYGLSMATVVLKVRRLGNNIQGKKTFEHEFFLNITPTTSGGNDCALSKMMCTMARRKKGEPLFIYSGDPSAVEYKNSTSATGEFLWGMRCLNGYYKMGCHISLPGDDNDLLSETGQDCLSDNEEYVNGAMINITCCR